MIHPDQRRHNPCFHGTYILVFSWGEVGSQQISKTDSVSEFGIGGDKVEAVKAGRARSVEGQSVADLNRVAEAASDEAENDLEILP